MWFDLICKLFHARDAAAGKARRCTDRTTRIMVVNERRWRRPSTSAVRRTLSAMVDSLRHRNARTQRRNWIRSGTRNQLRSRGEAGWCVRSAWVRTRVGRQHWAWTAACPVDDRRHRPARNSSSRPCWQPKHGLLSAGRVVEDSAAHSESDVVMQSTIWRWQWRVFTDWRRSRYIPRGLRNK